MAEEFSLDFELDEIYLGGSEEELPIDTGLPKVYMYVENLVMIRQIKGLVEEAGDLVTVDVYADKNGVPTYVGLVELTSENVLTMKHLGLGVSLVREGKEPILFDKAEHFVEIIKTLKVGDTVDTTDSDIFSNNGGLAEGSI